MRHKNHLIKSRCFYCVVGTSKAITYIYKRLRNPLPISLWQNYHLAAMYGVLIIILLFSDARRTEIRRKFKEK